VIGSGIMAERLAGGNQAIALLGNTIPTGAILVVIITILGPVSGAHFNPAVSLVFAGRGDFPWSEVAPYVVVQCLGGIGGTVIAHLMFDLVPLAIGTTTRSGPSQWLAEGVVCKETAVPVQRRNRDAPSQKPAICKKFVSVQTMLLLRLPQSPGMCAGIRTCPKVKTRDI
jgi:glycerol uptake facilitator-like aquaporin